MAPPVAASRVQYAVGSDRACLRLSGRAELPGVDADDPAVRRRLVFQDRAGRVERSLPLPGGADFTVEAPLSEPSLALHDATWDLYVETEVDGGRPVRRRLAAERVETRDDRACVQPGGDHRFRPYVTAHGKLSVEARATAGHVEVAEIWVRDHLVKVNGELTGVDRPGDLPVIARRRDDREAVRLPADWSGPRVSASVDLIGLASRDESSEPELAPDSALAPELARGEGPEPAREGAAAPELARNRTARARQGGAAAPLRVWDLSVVADGRELRFATYLDDIPDKRRIMVYPPRDLAVAGALRRLRPGYTARDTVAVSSRRAT